MPAKIHINLPEHTNARIRDAYTRAVTAALESGNLPPSMNAWLIAQLIHSLDCPKH